MPYSLSPAACVFLQPSKTMLYTDAAQVLFRGQAIPLAFHLSLSTCVVGRPQPMQQAADILDTQASHHK